MSKLFAAVSFPNGNKLYTYNTEISNLVKGDIVEVDAKGSTTEATFEKYIPEEFVLNIPVSKIHRKIEVDSEPKVKRASQQELRSAGKIVVSFIRQSTLAQRWVTKRDIVSELSDNGYEHLSFESVIKQARNLSEYINQFQKNAYIYKKREA